MKHLSYLLLAIILVVGCSNPVDSNPDPDPKPDPKPVSISLVSGDKVMWDTFRPLEARVMIQTESTVTSAKAVSSSGVEHQLTLESGNTWRLSIAKPTVDDSELRFQASAQDGGSNEEIFNFTIVPDEHLWLVKGGNSLYRLTSEGSYLLHTFATPIQMVSVFSNKREYLVDTETELCSLDYTGELKWCTDLQENNVWLASDDTIVYTGSETIQLAFEDPILPVFETPVPQVFTASINVETGVIGTPNQLTHNSCPSEAYPSSICTTGGMVVRPSMIGDDVALAFLSTYGQFPSGDGLILGKINLLNGDVQEVQLPLGGVPNIGGVNPDTKEVILHDRNGATLVANYETGDLTIVPFAILSPGQPYPAFPASNNNWITGLQDGNPSVFDRNGAITSQVIAPFQADEAWLERPGS